MTITQRTPTCRPALLAATLASQQALAAEVAWTLAGVDFDDRSTPRPDAQA